MPPQDGGSPASLGKEDRNHGPPLGHEVRAGIGGHVIGYVATLYIGILFAGLAVAFVFAAVMSLRWSRSVGMVDMDRRTESAAAREESAAEAA